MNSKAAITAACRVFATLICAQTAFANSWVKPPQPPEPRAETLLATAGLSDADEERLLKYVSENAGSVETWIPSLSEREYRVLVGDYFDRLERNDPDAQAVWKKRTEQLAEERIRDSRRVVDAALRKLGQSGTSRSIRKLLEVAIYSLERPWAKWKIYAAIQEIMERQDAAKATYADLQFASPESLAPLLRDVSPQRAEAWAWAVWESGHKPASPSFRSVAPLPARLWLARFFAGIKPTVAAEVFYQGLQSPDAAVRSLAEMLLRQGIGKSVPYGAGANALVKELEGGKWKPTTQPWEVMPQPLIQPVAQQIAGTKSGRTDLVWLDGKAEIVNRKEDVWPLLHDVLPNGLFHSRIGDTIPATYALTNSEGEVYARFPGIDGGVVAAIHGGIWTIVQHPTRAIEFAPNGSVLWELPISSGAYRMVTPYRPGQVLLLGYKFLECRNRRGDLVWRTEMEKMDDPRFVLAVDEETFLVSCGKSIGWMTKAGAYTAIEDRMISAGWIRYHPAAEWVIFDGGDWSVSIYDAAKKGVTGRFDLDDPRRAVPSKFTKDPFLLPE